MPALLGTDPASDVANVLPFPLPSLLLNRSSRSYTVRPRAAAPDGPSPSGSTQASASSGSSSPSSSSASSLRPSNPVFRLPGGYGGLGAGMGIGGGLYVRAGG